MAQPKDAPVPSGNDEKTESDDNDEIPPSPTPVGDHDYKSSQLQRLLTAKKEDNTGNDASSRFMTDMSQYRVSSQPQKADLKRTGDEEKINDSNVTTNSLALASSNFGEVFDYWNSDSPIRVYVPKTHDSLRTEALNSRYIYGDTYETLLKKAESLYRRMYDEEYDVDETKLKPIYAKQKPYYNDLFGIACGSRMSVDHIMAIILYTDTTELKRYFLEQSRDMRPNGVDETYGEIAAKNGKFANWFRLLYECVWIYGDELQFGKRVYHGVNCKLLFDSLQCDFRGPLSTTVDETVAMSWSGTDGIILELTNEENLGQPYFDVQYFSKKSEEREYLFYNATLKIVSIRIYDEEQLEWLDYKKHCSFLHLYLGLLSGSEVCHALPKKSKILCDTTMKYVKFHSKSLQKQKHQISEDDYISQLMDNFTQQKRTIWINLRQIRSLQKISKKFRILTNKFIKFDSDDDDASFVVGEYLVTLMSNRPLLSLSFAAQYEWTVDAGELQELISGECDDQTSGWWDFWIDGDIHDDRKMCSFMSTMVLGNERFHASHQTHDNDNASVQQDFSEQEATVGLLWTYCAQNEAEYPSVMVDVEVYCPDIGFYAQLFNIEMKNNQRVGNPYLFPLKRITDHALKSFRWFVVIKSYPISAATFLNTKVSYS